jgi:hypothetical protein
MSHVFRSSFGCIAEQLENRDDRCQQNSAIDVERMRRRDARACMRWPKTLRSSECNVKSMCCNASCKSCKSRSTNRGRHLTSFGVPTLSNAGCGVVTGASFTGGTSNCAGVTQEVDELTIGFWQNLYKGDYGRVATGLQYQYLWRKSFDGVSGPATTIDNVGMASLRYYPF